MRTVLRMTEHPQHPAEDLVTLADVAVLAQVQRPVVTMWRSRPHREAGAFPSPVAEKGQRAWFERAAVVTWLAASGRGNNPEAAQDAALHARPPVPTPAGRDLAAALLFTRMVTDTPLTGCDREDLLDLADEADPDDRVGFTEVAAATAGDLVATAEYVDALVDASYGGADALVHLTRDPSRFGLLADATAPAADVLAFVGDVVRAVARAQREHDDVPVVDPTGCAADVVLAAARSRSGDTDLRALARPATVSDLESRTDAIRDSWRTLALHGLFPEPIDVGDEGHVDVTVPAVLVARYPHPGAPALTPERLLEEVDDVLVQLKDDQRAILLGPASVLTDALGGRAARQARRAILDTGRLRALVRFDARSVPAAPQRRLALWVVGPAPTRNFRAHGRTAVADLAALDLEEVGADLVSDIVAALEDRPISGADETQGRAHVFRVARYQRTFSVLARDGDLVPRDIRVTDRARVVGAEAARRAHALAESTRTPAAVAHVEVQPAIPAHGRVTTIRELLDEGKVRVLRGTRLAGNETRMRGERVGPGEVPVVGGPELTGETRPGERVVDLLAFTAAHPRASRTEAGDVVFVAGPRPGAWVDARGGAVVEAPAKAMRAVPIDGDGDRVIPRVLAADLERGRGSQWRAFAARLVPVVEADTLTQVLDSIAVARDDALRRAAELTELTELLADGVVAGQVTPMMDPVETEGR